MLQFWKRIAFAILVVLLATASMPQVPHYGAPWPPELVSPGNGQSSSNPPTLCARDMGDPEGESVSIKFEAWGGGEGNHASDWIGSSGAGSTVCWTDTVTWSEGGHQWQARAKDSNNEQSGASPEWTVNVPAPPGSGGGDSGSGGGSNASCSISYFYFDPPPPAVSGSNVAISVGAECTNGVDRIKVSVEGTKIGVIQGGSGTVVWNTSGYKRGGYNVRVDVADNNAGFIKSVTDNYDIVEGSVPEQVSVSCDIQSIDTYPSSPQRPGTVVSIYAKGDCNTGVRAMRIKINGGVEYEIGSPDFKWDWNTKGWNAGEYKIRIEAAGMGDNSWKQAGGENFSFTLKSDAPVSADPNQAFANGDLVKIGTNVYVVIKEGSAIQIRHIPNDTTLYALGFNFSMVNNKGFSDQALSTLGKGSDVPDVVVDPNGFATFKATFFPNTSPYIEQGEGEIYSGEVEAIPNGPKGLIGDCPASPAVLIVGQDAVIAGKDLNLRHKPGVNNEPFDVMPSGARITVVDGPKCRQEVRWFIVEYNGHQGWAAEVGTGGEYHMYPVSQKSQPTEAPAETEPQIGSYTEQVEPATEIPAQTESNTNWFCENLGMFCPILAAEASVIVLPARGRVDDGNGLFLQCAEYAAERRPDSLCWLSTPADAGVWVASLDATERQALGITIDKHPDVGDIVEFTGCPKGYPTQKHLAVVRSASVDGKKFGIDDANRNLDGKKLEDNWQYDVVESCMNFISSPTRQYSIKVNECIVYLDTASQSTPQSAEEKNWVQKIGEWWSNLWK